MVVLVNKEKFALEQDHSRNNSEESSVFSNDSGRSTSTVSKDSIDDRKLSKFRHFSTKIISGIRSASSNSLLALKSIAQNGDFVTVISLYIAGQGSSFFTLPWCWANGSLVTCIIASICKIVGYSYIGIIIVNESEKCVGKIPTLGKKEIPELSQIVEHKFGKTAGISSVIVGTFYMLISVCTIFLFICRSLYHLVLSAFVIHKNQFQNEDISENTTFVKRSTFENSTIDNLTRKRDKTIISSPSFVNYSCGNSSSPILERFEIPETFSETFWNLNMSIPFYCLLLIFLINVQSSVFFQRIATIFGLPSTIIISIIVFWKASVWTQGCNSVQFFDAEAPRYYPLVKWTFTVFPAFFYNTSFMPTIISVIKNNRNRNNTRTDIVLSQILCQSINLIVGLTFVLTFPGEKNAENISQNFVEHFSFYKPEFLIASLLIFLRAVGAFSLNFQCLRGILSAGIFKISFPGYSWSIVMSVVALACSLLCGIFYNNPGKLLGIGGSVTGVYYAFMVASFDLKQYGSFFVAPWYVYIRSGLLAIFSIALLIFQLLVTFGGYQ